MVDSGSRLLTVRRASTWHHVVEVRQPFQQLVHTVSVHDDAVDAAAAKTAMERASAKAKRRRGGSDVSSRTLSHVYEGANEKKPIILRYLELALACASLR